MSPSFDLGKDDFLLILGASEEIADGVALHLGLLAIQIAQDVIDVPSRVCPAVYDSVDRDRGMSELRSSRDGSGVANQDLDD
ncbi:hypothetical protein [Burkholderia arboris]|uniref:hypothetical protein n=1 Tax=Burkholderia arboris TaxID=488730 RepID=UPI0015815EC4|nr:hypothetical protein [Burkholderia arboris]